MYISATIIVTVIVCTFIDNKIFDYHQDNGSIGIDNLLKVLSESLFVPHRSAAGPFLYSVDHCFAIRGQGTVMTGTVLSGCVQINDVRDVMIVTNKYLLLFIYYASCIIYIICNLNIRKLYSIRFCDSYKITYKI
jgi:hypothetical protein